MQLAPDRKTSMAVALTRRHGTMLLTAFEVKFSDAISSRPWTCSTSSQQSIVGQSDGKLLPATLSHHLIVSAN